MNDLTQDLRYALRGMLKRPAFTLLIVVMLAVGIGANAVVFTMVDALVLRPLPYEKPDQLVFLDETAPSWGLEFVSIRYPDFYYWRERSQSFEVMMAMQSGAGNLVAGEHVERISASLITPGLERILGVAPILGRSFKPADDLQGAPRVALISHSLHQSLFAGRSDVLDQTLRLNGEVYSIIGVMPPGIEFPRQTQVWLPLRFTLEDNGGSYNLKAVGRLKPGVTLQQARSDLEAVHSGLQEEELASEAVSPVLMPLRDRFVDEEARGGALALLSVAGIVLLIACANVSGLLLSRGAGRSREMGVRCALGARRTRLIGQLLSESLLLAALGGAAGLLAARAGLGALLSLIPDEGFLPSFITLSVDWRAAAFAGLLCVTATLVFGLLPAWSTSRSDLQSLLADSARGASKGPQRKLLNGLVVGEVALALLLAIGAGLLLEGFKRLNDVDPGFLPQDLLTFRISLPLSDYPEAEQRQAFVQGLKERLSALPGVSGAGVVSHLPLGGHTGYFIQAEGGRDLGDDRNPVVLRRVSLPGYLKVMGIRLLAGRDFSESEGQPVAIVNQTLADTFWEDGQAVGRRIRYASSEEWMTVIGVTQDVKHYGIDEEMRPGIYIPYQQAAVSTVSFALRSRQSDMESLTSQVRAAVQERDAALPIYSVEVLSERLAQSLWGRRALAWVFAGFAATALLLAVGGLYGVISYSVNQRRFELGIRMAVGAGQRQVMRQVMRHGLLLSGAGMTLGLLAAWWLMRFLTSLLIGVSPTEPLIYAAAFLLLAASAGAANLVPAWRASRLDPVQVLRF